MSVFHVNENDIAVSAFFETTFAHHVVAVSNAAGHPVDHVLKAARTVLRVGQHDGKRGLHAGHAAWCAGKSERFCLERVGCMVRSDALDGARFELPPQGFTVLCITDWGVHLQASTLSGNVRFVKGQVLRQCFRGDDGAFPRRFGGHDGDVLQPVGFNSAGEVKHVETVPRRLCQFHGELGCDKGRFVVPPFGVCGHVRAPLNEFESFVHPRFVFGMNGDEPARAVEDGLERGAVVHQERARRRPHEDLDAADARDGDGCIGCAHSILQVADVVRCGTDEKSVVVDALFGSGLEFPHHSFKGGDGRLVVRHVQERRDAAADGCSRPGSKVFFLGLPGVSEVDLGVDHARHEVEPRSVNEQLIVQRLQRFAERHRFNHAVSNAKVSDPRFIGQHHGRTVN